MLRTGISGGVETAPERLRGKADPALSGPRRLSGLAGGASIYLKREDLAHTGAHKINNTLGQALLAKWMGKTKVIAETGAGQHGVATATVAALFGMECKIFMGIEDISRQAPNVQRMKLLGAEVVPVDSGSGTLKDAMNEAMRYWVGAVRDTFYVIGSVAGPHPYPAMVRDFQRVIGDEAKTQIMEAEGRLPDMLVACVGGGSNAMGLFYPFLDDPVEMVGVEAAGRGIDTGRHASTLGAGSVGVLHGSKSYVLQDGNGQIREAYSISAGLDYPGVGPEHSWLKDTGRVRYESVTDEEALRAFHVLSSIEGIIPALESSHAVAQAMVEAAGCRRQPLLSSISPVAATRTLESCRVVSASIEERTCRHEQNRRDFYAVARRRGKSARRLCYRRRSGSAIDPLR